VTASAVDILIVEDDRDTREMLERFLQFEGFGVRSAPNGEVALATLHAGTRPSVILLDLMMPVMNGWQFRQAQAHHPAYSGIPVVVVTAAGSRADIPPIEAHGWLAKPLDLERLLETIQPFCRAGS
jgi:CheY-like chemotaxis protein